MPWDPEGNHQQLEGTTIVHDKTIGRNVLWIDGVVTLPVGAVVELHDPETLTNANAPVIGVRLLCAAGSIGPQVCIDVAVPEGEWWEKVGGVS